VSEIKSTVKPKQIDMYVGSEVVAQVGDLITKQTQIQVDMQVYTQVGVQVSLQVSEQTRWQVYNTINPNV
jgi:hypothetical protein